MGGKGSGRKPSVSHGTGNAQASAWWSGDLSELNQLSDYSLYMKARQRKWAAGVDYIRATEPLHVAQVGTYRECIEWVNRVIEGTGVITVEPKGQQMLGFKGYQVDSVFAGVSGTHTMYQVSGGRAHEGHKYLPVGAGVTRIDIALTVWFEQYHPRLAEALARSAAQFTPTNGRPPAVTLTKSYRDEGDTLAVGSRASEVYIRLYDKFAESKHSDDWAYAWRWEVELKGTTAQHVYTNYRSGIDNATGCAAIVASMCKSRGLPCIGLDYALASQVTSPTRAATDYEEKLAWLRKQVAPTLQRLKADGATDAFLAALLGIDED